MQNQLKSFLLFERWITSMIMIKNQFSCNYFIQYWIHIVNQLQPIITITYTYQYNSNWGISNLIYELYITIIRPEIGISKFISIEVLFAVVIVIVLSHKIIIGLLLMIFNSSQNKIPSATTKIMMWLAGVYQQSICKFLAINLQTICFILIQQKGNSFAYSMFSWLLITTLQIEVLIGYLVTESPLTYRMALFEKSKILISTIICNLLKIVSHIMFYCITNADNEKQMVFANSAIVILISLIEIIEQLWEKIYIFKSIQILLFSINVFNILFSIFKIFEQTSANNSALSFCLITLYPIFLYFTIIINNRQDYDSFIALYQSNSADSNNMLQELIKVINSIEPECQLFHMRDIFIYLQHKQYCQLTDCACKCNSLLTDVEKMAPLTLSMKQQYYKKKLTVLSSQLFYSVQGSKQKLLEQVINHSIMLYDFGYSINSMKTLHSILFSNQKNSYFGISYTQNHTTQTKGDTNTLAQSNNSETAEQKEFNLNFKVNLNIIQRLKLQYIINLAKQCMKEHLSQSFFNFSQNLTIEYLQKFLEFEFQMNEIKSMILQEAQQKINYYQKLYQDNSFNLNNIIQITRDTCSSMISTHDRLKKTFTSFPCVAIQRAICYYESEIINNYSEARKVNNQTAISDEKFLMFNQNLVSKDKIGYIIVEIENDFATTDIKFASHEFQRIFERQDYDTKIILDDLLPKFVLKSHPSLIERFLTTGRSNYFQNFQLNFLCTHEGFIKGVKMCYDTTRTQKQHDKLIFAVFFSEMSDSKAYLLVDGITKHTYFSLSFFKKLGFQDHEIKFIKNSNIIQNLTISYLIPDFDTQIEMNDEKEIKVQGIDIYFANVFQLFSTIFTEKKVPSTQNFIQKFVWQKRDRLFKFTGNIQITKRLMTEYQFYIVELLNVEENSYTNILESCGKIDYTRKDISIDSNNSFNSGLMDQHEHDRPNKISVFQFVKDEFTISHHCIDSLSQPRIKIMEAARMITPNDSSSDTKRKFHSRNQQEFYSQKLSQADVQAFLSEKKLVIPSDDDQQQIKIDIQSDNSSIEDVQKKKFLKKFELVDKLMVYKRPLKLIEILGLLTLQNITFTIFSLIAITVMFTDLSQSLKEIDAISLHSSIMTKHDIFFSMRATIALYTEYGLQNIVANSSEFALPFYQHLKEGYEDFQSDLFTQFQDTNIQSYIDDNFITIYQLSNLENYGLEPKNVTIRESLIIDAQYQLALLNSYLQKQNAYNSSSSIFQFSNYVNIHEHLENLTLTLLNNSTGRSTSVAAKWMIIWIFFQIGALVLAVYNFYCYYNYITFYDKFLLTLKFIELDVINNEIERYKVIIKQIRDNSRFLFEYSLDINIIQQSNERKQRQLSIKQKENVNKKTIKLRRFSSFMLIFLLNLIFGGYSAIINQKTQIYFAKYEKTANLYKLFQDLSLGGGNCFLYKEILLGFDNYQFFLEGDRDLMYSMLENSQTAIQNYLQQSNAVDFTNYLALDQFITFFDDLKTNNICQYIDQVYLQPYCLLSLDGSLQQGLVSTLNYVYNSIQTQQAINNFTTRTEYILYEQEANQIITRVFFNMSLQFKAGLTTLTQDQTDLAYNLSISFFVYSFIVTFCLLFYLKSHLTWEYFIIRRVVSLIPMEVLLYDETLDRYLRELALHQELL